MKNCKCNLQVLRGLDKNLSLMSCTSDGDKVDLWNEDDGSGRQKWELRAVDGYNEVFNILVSGGTIDGNKIYLSCTSDGDKVDLWHEDDGSGHQRWHLTPVTSNIPGYYNIQCVGGVDNGRTFLSCTASGDKVDLWHEDDGSGRQRWQIQAF